MGRILCATRGGEESLATQQEAIDLALERGDELVYLFVVDTSFLGRLAAPIVIDVESRLAKVGSFQLALACERAAADGVDAQAVVRQGSFRAELIAAALELGATLVLLGRPGEEAAVFQQDTLEAFATGIQAESGIEVRIV